MEDDEVCLLMAGKLIRQLTYYVTISWFVIRLKVYTRLSQLATTACIIFATYSLIIHTGAIIVFMSNLAKY